METTIAALRTERDKLLSDIYFDTEYDGRQEPDEFDPRWTRMDEIDAEIRTLTSVTPAADSTA